MAAPSTSRVCVCDQPRSWARSFIDIAGPLKPNRRVTSWYSIGSRLSNACVSTRSSSASRSTSSSAAGSSNPRGRSGYGQPSSVGKTGKLDHAIASLRCRCRARMVAERARPVNGDSAGVPADQLEEGLAVALELDRADARDRQQVAPGARSVAGDGLQGRVVEDHVRRNAGGAREVATPFEKCTEELGGCRVELSIAGRSRLPAGVGDVLTGGGEPVTMLVSRRGAALRRP